MEVLVRKGVTAPTHSGPRHKMGVSGECHAPAAFYPPRKGLPDLFDRRLCGLQSRNGRRSYKKYLLPLPGIETRSSIRHYTDWATPAHFTCCATEKKIIEYYA
jgi:hypothetical protein